MVNVWGKIMVKITEMKLRRHMTCDECGKKFTMPNALKNHRLNNHTQFPKHYEDCGVFCLTKKILKSIWPQFIVRGEQCDIKILILAANVVNNNQKAWFCYEMYNL